MSSSEGSRVRVVGDESKKQLLAGPIDPARTGIDQAYFRDLVRVPASTLIHLIFRYHGELLAKGETEGAAEIRNELRQLIARQGLDKEPELHGMQKLLSSEGLLNCLININRHLPPVKAQIVKFKDLTFSTKRPVPARFPTLASQLLEMLKGPFKRPAQTVDVDVIKGVSGYIMPGTLTLVLGAPGCGKATLLKAIAGRLRSGPGGKLGGSVMYNNKSGNEVVLQRLCAVADQLDAHLPFLTVKETLQFARNFSQAYDYHMLPPELQEFLAEALERGEDPKLELTLHMFGLNQAAGKLVGSAHFPTIPPDERHKLTAAEMFAGTHALYVFDELNKGVDSAVTYELAKQMLYFSRVRRSSVLVTLLQPSPEVFDLFDRVIVMGQGQVVYQGSRLDALPYFASLGYQKPEQLETAEFLIDLATERGLQHLQPGFEPLSHEGLVAAYEKSSIHQAMMRIVDSPELIEHIWMQANQPLGLKSGPNGVIESVEAGGPQSHPDFLQSAAIRPGDRIVAISAADGSGGMERFSGGMEAPAEAVNKRLASMDPIRAHLQRPFEEKTHDIHVIQYDREYIRSMAYEMRELTRRYLLVTWRNKFVLYARLCQVTFLAFFSGFCLFQASKAPAQNDMNLRRSIEFLGIIVNTLMALGQLPNLFEERAVFYKQQGARFFRPFSYWFGLFVGSLPFSLVEATIWTVLVYFLTGLSLADSSQHFWVYYVVIFLIILHAASMARFLAFWASNPGIAGAFAAVLVATGVLFAGFILPRFKVPPYFIWIFYINPLQWGITALLLNEFDSKTYAARFCSEVEDAALLLPQCLHRQGLGGSRDDSLGHAWLAVGEFYTSENWIAVAVFMLVAWIVIWNFFAYRCMKLTRYIAPLMEGGPRPPMPQPLAVASSSSNVDKVPTAEKGDLEAAGPCIISKHLQSFPPVTLSWHDLGYSVDFHGLRRPLLQRMSGWAKPGELLAIVGASGSGHKTLIDVLAGRFTDPRGVTGAVLVNGYPKAADTFGRAMAYVDRADAYWPTLTIRESLLFSAATRGARSSDADRQSLVDDVLEVIGLTPLADRLVQTLGSGFTPLLSKRLSVAVELAANPSVLFLDGANVGLESLGSVQLATCLERIASTGRTVIASLHFPSVRLMSKFDMCLLLKRGGTCVYFGPVGHHVMDVQQYFDSLPGVPLCPPGVNPVYHALELIGDGFNRAAVTKYERDFEFEYVVSDLAVANRQELAAMRSSKGAAGPLLEARGYAASFGAQLYYVVARQQKYYYRNVGANVGRVLLMVFLGLYLGFAFWQENYLGTVGMNARAGQIFAVCLFVAVANGQAALPGIAAAKPGYMRERAVNSYSSWVYSISWGFSEVTLLLVLTLIFTAIACGLSGLATSSVGQFFLFWFILYEFTLTVVFLAMLLAFAVPFPPLANILVSVFISVIVPTSGYIIPKIKVEPEYIWVFWLNPLQYALNAMTSVAFFCHTQGPLCKDNGLNPSCGTIPAACPQCPCPRLSSTHVFVWDQLKLNRSLDHTRVGTDIMALALFAVLFRVLAILALRFLSWNRKV